MAVVCDVMTYLSANSSCGLGARCKTYTNHDVLGCAEQPVQSGADEASVQAIFGGKGGQQRVGHGLRYDDEADRDTGDGVADQPMDVVAGKPLREDQNVPDVFERGAPGGNPRPQPLADGRLAFGVDVDCGV